MRAFRSVGGTPLFIAKALGARVEDEDGRSYLDYIGSWGPMILGHGHPAVVEAIRQQATRGTSFGAPSRLEVEMAEALVSRVTSLERVRMVNSGTEATMAAVRAGPRRHWPGEDREVRGLLPRPRRRLSDQGGLRRGHLGRP